MEVIEARRQLIPRWHTSKKITGLHVSPEILRKANSNLNEIDLEQFRFQETIEEWNQRPNISAAIELMVKSIQTGETNKYTEEVKAYLELNESLLSDRVRDLLRSKSRQLDPPKLYTTSHVEIYKIIRSLKQHLLNYPADSLLWSDLAFYYAAIGVDSKSEKCMRVSFESSNRNAIIARAYSRLFVHQGSPDEALRILRDTGQQKTNPILLSADISIRTVFNIGKPDIKLGLRLLEKFKAKPWLTSELGASIGSIEIENGAQKHGRKLLEGAIAYPTENTIAQLHWLAHKKLITFEKDTVFSMPSLEGVVMKAYANGQYEDCKNALLQLHNFQPFSERPIIDASYLNLVALNNPQEAIDIYQANSSILKGSFLALNNYVVALLEIGNIEEAITKLGFLKKLTSSKNEKTVFKATSAMLLYKIGDFATGKALYEDAVNDFTASKDDLHLARLYYYFGKQEIEVDNLNGRSLLIKSKKMIEKSDTNKEILLNVNKLIPGI